MGNKHGELLGWDEDLPNPAPTFTENQLHYTLVSGDEIIAEHIPVSSIPGSHDTAHRNTPPPYH